MATRLQWNEFQRFAPGIKTVVYHGDPKKRDELRRTYKLTNTAKAADCVVITTYEMVMNDRAKLQNLRYGGDGVCMAFAKDSDVDWGMACAGGSILL